MAKSELEKLKDQYEDQLNDNSPDFESDDWIMGGIRREYLASRNLYGQALRTYSPISFEAGFNNDFLPNHQK